MRRVAQSDAEDRHEMVRLVRPNPRRARGRNRFRDIPTGLTKRDHQPSQCVQVGIGERLYRGDSEDRAEEPRRPRSRREIWQRIVPTD